MFVGGAAWIRIVKRCFSPCSDCQLHIAIEGE
jgi:hypothetical protein